MDGDVENNILKEQDECESQLIENVDNVSQLFEKNVEDIECDSDDTDLDKDAEYILAARKTTPKFDCSGKATYLAACKMFKEVPASYFLRNLDRECFTMKHHGLGVSGTKALCTAMLSNTTIESLDLEDNGLTSQGCLYIADILKENYFITVLNISNNSIGPKGAKALFEMIKQSDSLRAVNVSGNKFNDHSASHITEAMLKNRKLRELDLSCNGFGEKSGAEFGKWLAVNETLVILNVSFNSFRRKGVQLFFKGLQKNRTLIKLNFAYNGIASEGCVDLARCLKENPIIRELNIANNRIAVQGTVFLARALKANSTLHTLDVSGNLFMAEGCIVILEVLKNAPQSNLRFLSFGNTQVSKQFTKLQAAVEGDRKILIQHGGVTENWEYAVEVKKTLEEVLNFMPEDDLRVLANCLQNYKKNDTNLVSYLNFEKALKELEWQDRAVEMLRRVSALIKRGFIDLSSILRE